MSDRSRFDAVRVRDRVRRVNAEHLDHPMSAALIDGGRAVFRSETLTRDGQVIVRTYLAVVDTEGGVWPAQHTAAVARCPISLAPTYLDRYDLARRHGASLRAAEVLDLPVEVVVGS